MFDISLIESFVTQLASTRHLILIFLKLNRGFTFKHSCHRNLLCYLIVPCLNLTYIMYFSCASTKILVKNFVSHKLFFPFRENKKRIFRKSFNEAQQNVHFDNYSAIYARACGYSYWALKL